MKTFFAFAFLLFLAAPAYAEEALDRPQDGKIVTAWAKDAVKEALTFSHEGVKDRFGVIEKDFTTEGWTSFRSFLNDRKIMQDVLQYQKTLSATVPEEAAVIEEGAAGGRYRWSVQLAAEVKGMLPPADDGTPQVVPMHIKVAIVRVPLAEHPDGLKISSWELLPTPEDQFYVTPEQ